MKRRVTHIDLHNQILEYIDLLQYDSIVQFGPFDICFSKRLERESALKVV